VAQENVDKSRVELANVEQEIARVESGLSSIRTEAESAMSELSKNEVKVAETRARVQFLTEEITHEFSVNVSTLDWKHLLWHADDEPEGLKDLDLDDEEDTSQTSETTSPVSGLPPPASAAETKSRRRKKKENKGEATEQDLATLDSTQWDEIKAEVDALRQRIGAMGAVNLVAIEEYSELKQRYEFLKTQNDDLASAKAQLLKAIDDINQTSLEQFKVTFDQIRKNFAYTFQILFGGGRAEIELVTADDPLESGIEIVAQPPAPSSRASRSSRAARRPLPPWRCSLRSTW